MGAGEGRARGARGRDAVDGRGVEAGVGCWLLGSVAATHPHRVAAQHSRKRPNVGATLRLPAPTRLDRLGVGGLRLALEPSNPRTTLLAPFTPTTSPAAAHRGSALPTPAHRLTAATGPTHTSPRDRHIAPSARRVSRPAKPSRPITQAGTTPATPSRPGPGCASAATRWPPVGSSRLRALPPYRATFATTASWRTAVC